jgi:uncharacterized membrane protein
MRTITMIDSKKVGLILIFVSIVLFVALFLISSLIVKLRLELHKTCPLPPEACPYKGSLPTEIVPAFIIDIGIGIFGAFLIITSIQTEKVSAKVKTKIKQSIKSLKNEEKEVYDLIVRADGFIFQRDLIEKTGYSKVKISRILDKLETKGIVERRRRGMSNVVVLKHV